MEMALILEHGKSKKQKPVAQEQKERLLPTEEAIALLPVERRNLEDLKADFFFVRQKIDMETVTRYGCHMLEGVKFPPGVIDEHNNIIDGRIRYASLKEVFQKEMDVRVVKGLNLTQKFVLAVRLNGSGAVPMTTHDLETTVINMLKLGISRENIMAYLSTMFPPKYLSQRIRTASNFVNTRLCEKAQKFMSQNPTMTVEEAAKHSEVPVEIFQEYLKKKSGTDKRIGPSYPSKFSLMVGSRFSRFNMSLGQSFKKLVEDYKSGKIDSLKAESCFKKLSELINHQSGIYSDWIKRWENLNKT